MMKTTRQTNYLDLRKDTAYIRNLIVQPPVASA